MSSARAIPPVERLTEPRHRLWHLNSMPAQHAYDDPTHVTAVDGEVVLDGPDGVGLSMTPAAALETGKRLIAAAKQAARQPEAPEQT